LSKAAESFAPCPSAESNEYLLLLLLRDGCTPLGMGGHPAANGILLLLLLLVGAVSRL
jgi:hypothetical protein